MNFISNLDDCKSLINNIWTLDNTYDFVYISLGSKYNETQNTSIKSNAHYQMIPEFLKHHDLNKKILCICLDRFEDQSSKNINMEIIQRFLNINMDFIFYDQDETVQKMEYFLIYILSLFQLKNIHPDKCMIVNYIRFLHSPNHTEEYFEKNIPIILSKILQKTEYECCFYQWYGYHPNLYNCIYNYKKYHFPLMMDFVKIRSLLKLHIQENILDSHNIHKIAEFTKCTLPYIINFMKNTYDITYRNNIDMSEEPIVKCYSLFEPAYTSDYAY